MIPLPLHIHLPHFLARLLWCFSPLTTSPSPLSSLLIHFLPLPNTLALLLAPHSFHMLYCCTATETALSGDFWWRLPKGNVSWAPALLLPRHRAAICSEDMQRPLPWLRDLSREISTTLTRQDALALFELRLRVLDKLWTNRIHSKEMLLKGDIRGREWLLNRQGRL